VHPEAGPRGPPFSIAQAGRAAGLFACCLSLLLPGPAEARPSLKRTRKSPTTVGLGRNCKADGDCSHASQRCQKEADLNGNLKPVGFCILPCAPIDERAGQTVRYLRVEPTTENIREAKKAPPPRCPPDYQCRSAGQGIAVDTCVKE
jgi:hypothetical protein